MFPPQPPVHLFVPHALLYACTAHMRTCAMGMGVPEGDMTTARIGVPAAAAASADAEAAAKAAAVSAAGELIATLPR